jgi:hypothetical protein
MQLLTMRDQIVEKLRAVLSDGVDSECKVVYLLCECRKLMDKNPPDPPRFALRLYCHWALHVDLTKPGTTLPLLEAIEKFADSILAGSTDIVKENHVFREFLYLDTFRQELSEFLRAYDLPTVTTDEDESWGEFLKHYAGVIQDGSLCCRASVPPLKLVDNVVFNGRGSSNLGNVEFSWDINLLDGRTMTVEVQADAFPNGQPMFLHSVCLH